MTARTAIGWAVAGLALGLFESTTATFLSAPFLGIDAVLILVVYLVFRQRVAESYVVAMFAGVVLDVFAPDVAEAAWLKYLLIAILLFLMSKRFLTNYSIYSVVALMCVGQISAWVWQASLGVVFSSLSLHLRDASMWGQFGRALIIDIFCVGLIFVLDTFISKRFVHFSRLSV